MADLSDYLNLIPAPNNTQPKFMAWVSVLLQGLVDAANVADSLQTLFDLDTAVGDQLDKVGQWIGLTRYITEPLGNLFFSWDIPGLGWDQAQWSSPFAPRTAAIVALDDFHYRTLLKARVAANQWDGTIEGAYAAWADLFSSEGIQILIQNVAPKVFPPNPLPGANTSDGMHILLSLIGPPIDALTKALFSGGYLNMVPASVKVDAYVTQTVPGRPIFAFDVGPTVAGDYFSPPVNLGGWDIGCWGDFSNAPILTRPNIQADSVSQIEYIGASLTTDKGVPIEFGSHNLRADANPPIESGSLNLRADANIQIESQHTP
jgi:hypothetical protein